MKTLRARPAVSLTNLRTKLSGVNSREICSVAYGSHGEVGLETAVDVVSGRELHVAESPCCGLGFGRRFMKL